jgi:hypothetical protein
MGRFYNDAQTNVEHQAVFGKTINAKVSFFYFENFGSAEHLL